MSMFIHRDNLAKTNCSRISFLLIFTLLLAMLSFSSQADEEKSQRNISLNEAIRLTLLSNPELPKFHYLEQQYKAQLEQSAVGKKPELNVTLEDAFGSGDYSGFDNAQTTIGITWVLDKELIQSRVKLSKESASQIDFERQIKALDLSAATAKIFIENLALQEQIKLASSNVKEANNALKRAKARIQKGAGDTVDVIQMKASVAYAELTLEDLKHELKSRQYELMSQWGETSTLPVAQGNLLSSPALTSTELAFQRLQYHPLLSAITNKRRVVESQIEMARIEAEPRWSINTGIRRHEQNNDYSLVAGFSLPLGTRESNQGTIRSLRAEQSIYDVEALSLKQKLNTQVFVLLQEINHSQHVIDVTQETIIPLMKKAKDEVNKAYELGRASYLKWYSVQQDYLASHVNLINTYKTLHLQHIELQRLTGSSIQTLEN